MTDPLAAQLQYLKDVLGLHSVIVPKEPIVLDLPAAVSAVSPQSAALLPQALVKVRGDVTTARLLCFVANAGEDFILQGEVDSLAEKMISAMKLKAPEVAWVEWTHALSAPCPGEAIDAALGARVPVLLFGDETARSLLGATAVPGQWVDWSGVRLMATHDLRDLLKKPELKKPAWAHLQAVMRIL
jgi:hypothetical protein